jgi:uncharacterized damage-inducible protein DinB
MNRAAINEIFDYNAWAWGNVADQIKAHGEQLLARPAPGSGWPALGNCFGHIVFAYDVWLETLAGEPRREENEAPLISTLAELIANDSRARARFRECLASLSDDELQSDMDMVIYGQTLAYAPADILGNLVMHERGHHGDINTLFYQHGIDGGVPDYRWYVNVRRGYR